MKNDSIGAIAMSKIYSDKEMPSEVDFSNSLPNPYVGKVRKRITINIDSENIDYFKAESARTGIPYQTLINMFLTECREQGRHLSFT